MQNEKRSKIVLLVSTILIVLVAVFFMINSIVKNPLEGKWMSKGSVYYIEIDDEGEAEVNVTLNGVTIDVDLFYTMDKTAKTVTFKGDLESFADAAADSNGALTAADIDENLAELMTSFDYSLEKDTLTLTERESGEQFIFTKVK